MKAKLLREEHNLFPRRLAWWDLTGRQIWLLSSFVALLTLITISCAISPSPVVPLVLFAALGICGAALLRPCLALLLAFACSGLPQFVLPLPGHNMHLIEPVSLLCILVVVIRRPPVRLGMPHMLAVLFVTLAMISFIHVPEFSTKLSGYGADKRLLELLIIFTAFFYGSLLINYAEDTSSLLVAILLVSAPLYLIGLAQAMGIHLPALLEAAGAQNPRLTQGRLWGPFPWSVNFGMYLANLFAIALACWLHGTHRWHRCIGFIMLVATILEMVGTGTRSVTIAAAIVIVIAFLIARRLKLLCTTILLAGIVIASTFNKLLPLFMHDETSTANRLLIWNEAIRLIQANPWIGIGLQQFHYYYAQIIVSPASQLGPLGIHPHQQYLEWAMESGIGWLVIGILLLLSILFSCWHAYRIAAQEQRALLLAALLAVLTNIIIGFLDVPLDQLEGSIVLFLLAGLACGYNTSRLRRSHKELFHPPFCAPRKMVGEKVLCVSAVGTTLQPHGRQPAARAAFVAVYKGMKARKSTKAAAEHLQRSNKAVRDASRDGEVSNAAMPTVQKARRSVLIQLLSWGIVIPIIFPMTALLTRYLGPLQYGEYSLTLSFLTIFGILSGTGMDPLIIRQLSCQARTTWGNILSYAVGTRLLSTLLSGCAAVALACLLPIVAEQRNLFLIGSVSLLFSFSCNGLRMIYSHGFQAEQRVGILSLLEIANRVLTAGLVGVIVLLHLPLLWAYLLLVYSDLPTFLVLAIIACRRFGIGIRFSWARFREHFLRSLPLVVHDVLIWLSGQADLPILMLFSGPLSVGIYALASRVIDPLISIADAYVDGLYPLLCSKFAEGQKPFAQVYHEALRILALIIIPLAIFISVGANMIITLLGGQQFAAAARVVQLLIWAMTTTFFNRVNACACIAAHMERKVLFVTAISTSLNILANLLLIPRWQIIGAGAAALLSEIAGLCLFALLLRHIIRLLPLLGTLCLILIGNLPALALLLWQQKMPLFLIMPLALLLMVAGCMATRTLSINDVSLVRRMLFSPGQRAGTGPIAHKGQRWR